MLVFVGALNWGLVGLFDFNLVEALLGMYPNFVKLVYVLVGVSAVVDMKHHMMACCDCEVEMGKSKKKKK